MQTSFDFDEITETFAAYELINIHTDYVKGVIYETDLGDAKFVTPCFTFNGWCCDCWVLERQADGTFEKAPGREIPEPIKREYLGEPLCVITSW